MDKETFGPRKMHENPPSDFSDSSTSSKDSFILPDLQPAGQFPRSKSLSCIVPENFTTAEVRRIQERLIRASGTEDTTSLRNLSRSQKMTLASLALVDFMSFCSTSIMAPFFPREAHEKGVSATFTGLVFSFYALVMFISSPIFGKITPKFGAKFLFLLGIFAAGTGNILFGLLEYIENYTLFATLCLLIQGFEALGASAYSTASYIFVIKSFPNNIGSVIGILETFVGLGMSTGPVVGGLLYSLGGFSLPFFVLGVAMVLTFLVNIWLLPNIEDCDNLTNKSMSITKLIKIPAVFIKGLVIVMVSNVWSFLDPTLEPHLRDFNLTPEQVGLIFLLMAALYGISSPAWGWLADRIDNHWSMMVVGLFMSAVGLLLLGPCPFLPFLSHSLWMDLFALSIIGISVALALMPTFQGILTSAANGGYSDTMATYSVVAGIWSCMYSLGDFIGPGIGGFLLEKYDFPIASTIMAIGSLSLAIITTIFFLLKSNDSAVNEATSDSGINESWGSSKISASNENTPLLLTTIEGSCQSYNGQRQYYTQNNESLDQYANVSEVKSTISVSITGRGSSEI
ncbi:unnamed protein product [Phyllotreta striolata]|uniref:Major facilitator superfamily (MFS) profile domain-containing protein n=1 Tax=Phyllotreta striolata TaxID=444603 RepID=A0A9N9TRT0_PHYSR|nr:unnamed protein product [Phyllotreta striolata]